VAHELPQEVGDYGVLVASGCDPLRAIALNFLSALASLLGTFVALVAHRSVGGAEGSGGGGGEMGNFFLGFDRGVADAFVAGGFVFLAAGSAFGEASKATRGVWDEALVAACVALGVGACAATHAGGGCEHRHG
jgi:zinc transporter ZupT